MVRDVGNTFLTQSLQRTRKRIERERMQSYCTRQGRVIASAQGGDALWMLGVSDAFEEAVGGVKDREGDFFAVEIRCEARVMAATGFGEEDGFDAAAGREGFLGEPNSFDTDCAGCSGKATAESDAEFLEPAILARRDYGV